MLVILVPGRLSMENCEFEASYGNMEKKKAGGTGLRK